MVREGTERVREVPGAGTSGTVKTLTRAAKKVQGAAAPSSWELIYNAFEGEKREKREVRRREKESGLHGSHWVVL